MANDNTPSFYGYVPTRWICDTFLVLFSVTTVLHIVQLFYFKPRFYWLIPTIIFCGMGEIAGWSGRFLGSSNPNNYSVFMLQLVTTIIMPTFLTAALYTTMGLIIKPLGFLYSRLSPKAYIIIFVTADVVALVIQACGGAIASGADTRAQADKGANIMVGGIFFQMASITVFAALAMEYLLRFYYQKPVSQRSAPPESGSGGASDKRFVRDANGQLVGRGVIPLRIGLMVIGLVCATVLVFIRTVYRSIELLGGWDGRIITTEIYFNLLDGTPIVLAMFVLNVFHPARLLRDP